MMNKTITAVLLATFSFSSVAAEPINVLNGRLTDALADDALNHQASGRVHTAYNDLKSAVNNNPAIVQSAAVTPPLPPAAPVGTPTDYDNFQDGLISDNSQSINDLTSRVSTNEKAIQDQDSRIHREIQTTNDYVASVQQQSNDHDAAQDTRLTALENAPKPTNGKDGIDGVDGHDGHDGHDGAQGVKGDKGDTGAQGVAGANGKDGADGKDGVTTTVTQIQVDTATQKQVAANSRQVSNNSQQVQTNALSIAANTQALSANTQQTATQQRSVSDNSQRISKLENSFSSLKEHVEGNKKEARSGSAAAVAIASMPQVNASQSVMFSAGVGQFKNASALAVGASFNAGAATVKAGISTTTNDDFAAGAGIGFGF